MFIPCSLPITALFRLVPEGYLACPCAGILWIYRKGGFVTIAVEHDDGLELLSL